LTTCSHIVRSTTYKRKKRGDVSIEQRRSFPDRCAMASPLVLLLQCFNAQLLQCFNAQPPRRCSDASIGSRHRRRSVALLEAAASASRLCDAAADGHIRRRWSLRSKPPPPPLFCRAGERALDTGEIVTAELGLRTGVGLVGPVYFLG